MVDMTTTSTIASLSISGEPRVWTYHPTDMLRSGLHRAKNNCSASRYANLPGSCPSFSADFVDDCRELVQE
jgi:hypothetical protein